MVVVAIVVVVILVLAGALTYYFVVAKPSSSPAALESAAFDDGQIVTFHYNGTNTWVCTPSIGQMLPGDPYVAAASKVTNCESGNASQNAEQQIPMYVLVPGFAGFSDYGISSLGASSHGFPEVNGTPLLTQCPAAGYPDSCPDRPADLYAASYAAYEKSTGYPNGIDGLPIGVLPSVAEDRLLNGNDTSPNVYWGTILVLVLDPNIFPAQSSPTCTKVSDSNLSNPTGNCLTSFSALKAATETCSSSVVGFNSAVKNPLWESLVASGTPKCAQVYIPGVDGAKGNLNTLNENEYIPYSVSVGAPSSFPS